MDLPAANALRAGQTATVGGHSVHRRRISVRRAGRVQLRVFRPPGSVVPIRFAIAIPDGQSASLVAAGRHSVAVSPDGSAIVFAANGRLYLRRLSEMEAQPIAGSDVNGAAQNPTFSPDGQFVAFVASRDRTLRKLAAMAPRQLFWPPSRVSRSASAGTETACSSAKDGMALSACRPRAARPSASSR